MRWYWALLITIWTIIIIYETVDYNEYKIVIPLVHAMYGIYLAARLEKDRLTTGLITLFFGFLVIPVFLTNLKRPENTKVPWLYKDPPANR